MQVKLASTGLRRTPTANGSLETELLLGEEFLVEKERHGWAYGRTKLDNYPGYVDVNALADPGPKANHRISAVRTLVYTDASCKSTPLMWLSMNALVRVCQSAPFTNGYVKLAGGGWVFMNHLAPVSTCARDWVAQAERFIHVPYLWGGRDANHGVDCSGLIQNALLAAGIKVPRNSSQQEQVLVSRLDLSKFTFENVERGDLVFWDGHVGVMTDQQTLLHATADFMEVVAEPLKDAIARRFKLGSGKPKTIGRIA